MDFLDIARGRKSVRGFVDKNVPEPIIDELLAAAVEAPSGGNCQPWHFFVIRDRAVIQKIHDESCRQGFLLSAPVLFVVCTDMGRNIRYGERGRTLYAIQDTAAAIQNLLLCASSLRLGACWCGAFDEEAVKGILRLDLLRPVAIIPVGYYNNDAPKPARRPLAESVTYMYPAGEPGK